MLIIPAIDIINGKCVRLTKGDYNQMKIYNENPMEVAKEFEDSGIKRLHLVDLDGAKNKYITNYKVLESIASKTNLNIDFGGGIQSDNDIKVAFECGAKQITGGSIAVKDPKLFLGWVQKFGPEKIILGADVKGRKIAVSGWQEESNDELMPFLEKYTAEGLKYVISTDVSKDGVLAGPSFDLYEEIMDSFNELELIASGGVSCIEDVEKLNELPLHGVIIGKAIYEGKITLRQLEAFAS